MHASNDCFAVGKSVKLNKYVFRPNFDEVKAKLMNLGATYVVTEEQFQNANTINKLLKVHFYIYSSCYRVYEIKGYMKRNPLISKTF